MSKTPAERQRRHRAKRKAMLLQRDGAICRICGQPIDLSDISNVELDHRVPRARGGEDSAVNLQPAHRDCNRAKSAKPQVSVYRLLDAARFALKTIGEALALESFEGIRLARAVTEEARDALCDAPKYASRDGVTEQSDRGRDGVTGEEGEGLSRSLLGSSKSQRSGLREATESQDRKSGVTVTTGRDASNGTNDEHNGDSHVQRTAAAVTPFGAETELRRKPLKDAEMVAKAIAETERLEQAMASAALGGVHK